MAGAQADRADFLKKGLAEYLDKFRAEDGGVDVRAMVVEMFERKGGSAVASAVYDTWKEIKESILRDYPMIKVAEELEKEWSGRISNLAFPYWFALENFAEPEGECGEDNPAMCLPPDALAELYIYKQTRWLILASFATILAGTFLAILYSGRRRRYGLIRCCLMFVIALFVDAIGAISLLYPFFGNIFDVFWAPASAFIVMLITLSPKAGMLVLVKELMIVTDAIPLATVLALHSMLS